MRRRDWVSGGEPLPVRGDKQGYNVHSVNALFWVRYASVLVVLVEGAENGLTPCFILVL